MRKLTSPTMTIEGFDCILKGIDDVSESWTCVWNKPVRLIYHYVVVILRTIISNNNHQKATPIKNEMLKIKYYEQWLTPVKVIEVTASVCQ